MLISYDYNYKYPFYNTEFYIYNNDVYMNSSMLPDNVINLEYYTNFYTSNYLFFIIIELYTFVLSFVLIIYNIFLRKNYLNKYSISYLIFMCSVYIILLNVIGKFIPCIAIRELCGSNIINQYSIFTFLLGYFIITIICAFILSIHKLYKTYHDEGYHYLT